MLDTGSNMPKRRTRWRIATITAAILTAAAYVAQVEVARKLPFWTHLLITAFGALCAAVAIFLPFREEKKQRRLTEEAKELGANAATVLLSGMQDRLIHVPIQLIEITRSDLASRDSEKDRLKQLTIGLASGRVRVDSFNGKMTVENARACFYTYYDGPKERLVCEHNMWQGRGAAPPMELNRDSPHGTFMLNIIGERESKLLPDVSESLTGEHDYKALIAAPVIGGDQVFGMLTLDALDSGDLLEADHAAVRLYAQLLAAGLAF